MFEKIKIPNWAIILACIGLFSISLPLLVISYRAVGGLSFKAFYSDNANEKKSVKEFVIEGDFTLPPKE